MIKHEIITRQNKATLQVLVANTISHQAPIGHQSVVRLATQGPITSNAMSIPTSTATAAALQKAAVQGSFSQQNIDPAVFASMHGGLHGMTTTTTLQANGQANVASYLSAQQTITGW